MSKHKFLSPIARRDLIKWGTFVGAALGLPRWKVFEVLETSGGSALAQQAACLPVNQTVHIEAGNGGFAWFQLLWPHNDVAAGGNAQAALHKIGAYTMAAGTTNPLTVNADTPWKSLPGNRQVTAIMAGNNQTHAGSANTITTIATGVDLMAATSAVQAVSPTLVPVIAVGANTPYGTATGAARPARVNNAAGIVGLFNSAASSANGALVQAQDAAVFETGYKAFLGMHAAAGRSTYLRTNVTGKTAANLLGKNLATQLQVQAADDMRYGINAGTATRISEFARSLATAAKAFKMGLTTSMVMPAFNDDPHGAFANMANLNTTIASIGKALDAFYEDLKVPDPSCAGSTIADNLVLTVHGDTPKSPVQQGGWPDGTPGGANWVYVLGAGYLKTGWFGGISRASVVTGFDPATGNTVATANRATQAAAAGAAILHAVARGDERTVKNHTNAVYSGLIKPITS